MTTCKKCLLLEAGEKATYEEVEQYLLTLKEEELTDAVTYYNRIAACRQCDHLLSGMCLKCGCYVEIRARLKDMTCPDYGNERW